MVIRAVIFDLDGTLIDTTHEIQYIFNQLLEFYSLPKRSFDFFKENIGNGVEDLLQKSLPDDYSEGYFTNARKGERNLRGKFE